MNVFAEVKERITMEAVLQHFGLKKDRRGNILCPFHADHKPSCKIYEKSFYCWACGTGGDVINFTARYLNLPNKEAAEYLAGAFGIVTGEPETLRQKSERKRREQERREQQQWEEWQDNTFRTLTQYQQFMLEGIRSGSGHWWTKYHQKECIIEYYLDCLAEDPETFYQTYRNEVKRIAEAVDREYQNRRSAGG